jgi:thioredoxin-related protein
VLTSLRHILTEFITAAIIAVFLDTADAAKEVVQSEGMGAEAISGTPLDRLNVNGTPALLLVDRTGKVLKAWTGMLSPRQEPVIKARGCNARAIASQLRALGQSDEE